MPDSSQRDWVHTILRKCYNTSTKWSGVFQACLGIHLKSCFDFLMFFVLLIYFIHFLFLFLSVSQGSPRYVTLLEINCQIKQSVTGEAMKQKKTVLTVETVSLECFFWISACSKTIETLEKENIKWSNWWIIERTFLFVFCLFLCVIVRQGKTFHISKAKLQMCFMFFKNSPVSWKVTFYVLLGSLIVKK